MVVFIFLILLVWGLICIISPETAWELTSGWKFRNAEPSDAALVYLRIIGVVQILIGVWLLFGGLSG